MDQSISSLEKSRQQLYDYLKKEDIDYVNARSKKVSADSIRRKKSYEDPWMHCFYFNDNKSTKISDKTPICFTSSGNPSKSEISDIISNFSITDDEINYCKAALRREAFSRKLPDLSSKPGELRSLYLQHQKMFPENFQKQRSLYEEIVCNMMNFEFSLKRGLEVLNRLSEITISADATVSTVASDITKMRCIMQDFKTHTDSVAENIFKVVEGFEKYQELDEKMDRETFNFLAHFFPKFLVPRNMRKRGNTNI